MGVWGSTSRPVQNLKFHMVINIPKRNGNSLAANSYKKFVFFGPPYCALHSLSNVRTWKIVSVGRQFLIIEGVPGHLPPKHLHLYAQQVHLVDAPIHLLH